MAETGDILEGQQSNLQVQAIIRKLRKTLQEDLEPIHDRLDRLEGSQTNNPDEGHAENGSDQTPNQSDVSTSSSAHVTDPEVLPQGPVTRSKAKQFREALSLTCAKLLDSFDNVCALDIRLYNVLHADLTGERTCAQGLKLSSVEAWELVCSSFQLHEADTLQLAHFSTTQLQIMLTPILDPQRSKEAHFTDFPVSFGSGDQSDGQNEQNPPDLQLQALERMMRRIVSDAIEPLASRMDRIDGGSHSVHDEVQGEIEVDQSPRQRTPRQGRMQQVDDNISNIKVAIPSFQGRSDPDAYLTWESKVEHVFECYNYSEQKKVRLAAMEFVDYALLWWDQLLLSRRRTGEGPVTTWNEMKRIMRKRFVPSHYHRELYQKLQNLKQGSRTVEDFFKEMEMAIMRANIVEDREATMARFLAGLNTEIANIVELQHYVELEDMVHMAIKVEKQQRRKTVNRGNTPSKPFSNSFNAPKNFRKPAPQAPLQIRERAETSKTKPPVADVGRGKQPMHQERSRDILCFKCLGRGHIASQCPNRRTMLLLDSGEIESESEKDEPELHRETVQEEDDTLQSFETGDVLVIKRSLTTQPTQDNQQRENIFHTRCLVNNKVCVVIIDGGSCTNVASSIMVEKLGLKTTKHPNPYRLQWLNDGGEIKVTKQVLVPFTIGKYKDEFDRGTLHDGVTNRYSFTHAGQKITLAPLTPSQVQEDQVRLRNNVEEVKGKKKKMNVYASNKDIRKCLSSQLSFFVMIYKDHCLLAENSIELPAAISSLLQDYKDVFPDEAPKGLPPLRVIEHQIDFIPGATIPNQPAY
ncbi:hypothetical protein V6N13_105187 [Hibiscus sabdariffa]